MMKTYRKTYILLALFFSSLLVIWGLEYAGVRTEKERRLRETRILPGLIDVPEANIVRVSIERGEERIVFKRRGPGMGRWQIIEPTDAAAEPTRLEALVKNLKDLRRSIDSGDIAGPADAFGLAPPVATVRLWGDDPADGKTSDQPIATLAVGKAVRGVRYVRPDATGEIETTDSKLLTAIDLPMTDWREPVVMGIPTFQVASLTVKRPGQVIRAERNQRGQWGLTAPVHAPANPAKIESLLSALSSLRVVDGPKGFVADNVKDLAPFGLADSAVTVELTTNRTSDLPLVLHVGKPVPDNPERVYVRQGDQDDVVIVNAKALAEIPTSAVALRSQQVASIEVAAVNRIEVKARSDTFALTKGSTGWELTSPHAQKADTISVMSFLGQIAGLQASEFLASDRVKNPELDPPVMTVKIWEATRSSPAVTSPPGDPALVLHLGRHDALLKTVFARLDPDSTILAVPDTILQVLPKNVFAFRDLAILSLSPADVRKLRLVRAGRIDELEPNKAGEPNRWHLRKPVDAPADTRSVTQILAMLSNLRADQFVTDAPGDGKLFGLDHPLLEITWETDQNHRLKIGSPVPRTAAFYARTDEQPFVFTVKTEVLKPFEAELRDHVVLSFPLASAQRMTLNWGWPPRTVAFKHRTPTSKGQPDWVDEPGSDAAGIDQSRISALVKTLAQLETGRFVQYDGVIQPYTGLHRPRLTVEVMLSAAEPMRVVKIGYSTSDGQVFAAEGTSGSGPVFLLPAAAWDALIQSGQRFSPLPANVFAPAQ